MIWRVYNGWQGFAPVHALVEADDEAAALAAAVEAFKAEASGHGPTFYTPNEKWETERLELPVVGV